MRHYCTSRVPRCSECWIEIGIRAFWATMMLIVIVASASLASMLVRNALLYWGLV